MAEKKPEKVFNIENDKMLRIQTFNNIASCGLDVLNQGYEIGTEIKDPDAIILRSHKLTVGQIPKSVKVIGRAGAGVNNIPLDYCTKNNIVVFNTPGANANAVKELVLGVFICAARNIMPGLEYVKTLSVEDAIDQEVEKNKKRFKGRELKGKKCAIIGLGAIGMMVANAASALGLDVLGYDPYISVQRAWGLSRQVRPVDNIDKCLQEADFISIHMPLLPETKHFLDEEKLKHCKKEAMIFNFSRADIVDENAMKRALDKEKVAIYANDFPSKTFLNHPKVISTPHLGASTSEAEDNCAIMICEQIDDFLKNGNIKNAVNFPNCNLGITKEECRLVIINANKPNMVGSIVNKFESEHINISEMINKSKNGIAYNILDIDKKPSSALTESICKIDGVLSLRVI